MNSLNEEDLFTKEDAKEIYEYIKNPKNIPYIAIGITVFIGFHYMLYTL